MPSRKRAAIDVAAHRTSLARRGQIDRAPPRPDTVGIPLDTPMSLLYTGITQQRGAR